MNEAVPDLEGVADKDAPAEGVPVLEGVLVDVPDGVIEGVLDLEGVPDREDVGDTEEVPDFDGVTDGVPDLDGVTEGVLDRKSVV